MNGVLIKGTTQIEDTNSNVAINTGILAGNPTNVSSYTTILLPGANAQDLADAIQLELTTNLSAYSLIKMDIIEDNSDWYAWLTVANLI
jgi:hypothetical protein